MHVLLSITVAECYFNICDMSSRSERKKRKLRSGDTVKNIDKKQKNLKVKPLKSDNSLQHQTSIEQYTVPVGNQPEYLDCRSSILESPGDSVNIVPGHSSDQVSEETLLLAQDTVAGITAESQIMASSGEKQEDPLQFIMKQVAMLDDIKKNVDSTNRTVEDLKTSLEFTQMQFSEAQKRINELQQEVGRIPKLESEINQLKLENKTFEEKLIQQDNYSRKENVVIQGLTENKDENCFQLVEKLFSDMRLENFKVQRCHRLGPKRTDSKPRPLIMRFAFYSDKQTFMKNRHALPDMLKAHDDYSPETAKIRSLLRPIYSQLKQQCARAKLIEDKIVLDGKRYTYEQVITGQFPIDLQDTNHKSVNGMTLFSGELSHMSNLYHSKITINGQNYSSNEHYYQYVKCTDLGHHDIAKKVLQEKFSRNAMHVGNQVRAPEGWATRVGSQILKEAIEAKYANPHLAAKLKSVKGLIVEATKHKEYGIGHPFSSEKAQNREKWEGKNIMGDLLTAHRDSLIG